MGKERMKIRLKEKKRNIYKSLLLACAVAVGSGFPTEVQATNDLEFLTFGSGKFVELLSPLEIIPNTVEVEARLVPGETQRQVLFGNYDGGAEASFSLELTTDGKLRYFEDVFVNGKRVGAVDVRSEKAVKTDEMVQFSVVRDTQEDTISLYQDGELLVNKAAGKDLQDNVQMEKSHYIGSDNRKKYFLEGDIARVSLWEDERSQEEITNDASTGFTGIEQGLSHCWILSENNLPDMQVIDSAIDGINGKLVGFPFWDSEVYEKSGVDFSQGIERTEMQQSLSEAPLTVEAWLKMPESSASERGGVICGNYYQKYYPGISVFNFEIYNNGNPRLYYSVDNKEYQYIVKDINICSGQWVHVAMSYDIEKNLMSCYINGELKGTKVVDFTPVAGEQPLILGRDSRDSMNLKGEVSDIRIWSRTRSAEEIKADFNKTLNGDEKGLIANYLLNDTEKGIFYDSSVNENHAVPAWTDGTFASGDYSIAVIPDTQSLTSSYPEKLNAQMQWIKDHAEEQNINLAVQVGDLVNNNGSQTEWNRIKGALEILDGYVPYVFVPGNHDTSSRNTTMLNTNLPYSKYSSESTFGGEFENGKMDNTYSFFTMGGKEFMTIALEPAPRTEVLDWANKVAAEYPEKNIIVVTHVYLNYDGNRTNEDTKDQPNYENNACTGDEIWEKFASQHENIVLVLSGHVGYPDIVVREDKGVNGNTVQQIMCDAQFFDSEMQGLGMIMLMTFHENSDQVNINWYSTDRKMFFRQRNQFALQIPLTGKGEESGINLTSLNLAVTMAEKMAEEQAENKCYTAESWAAVETALEAAKALQENKEATQEQVDEAFINLITAYNMLENAPQKTGLKAAIEGAENILADTESLAQYTEASIENVRTALEAARLTWEDANATQAAINEATTNLLTAVTNLLTEKEDEATRLDILIEKAEQLLNEKDQYTPSSVDQLTKVLETAKDVAANDQATKEEQKAAYDALAKAMTELVRKANKDELKNALDKANEIIAQSDKYLADSLVGLQEATDAAQEVYDNQDADQETVSNALKELIAQILEVRLMGDVNFDGTVDTQDAAEVLKYNAELEELTEEQLAVADVNTDTKADSSDAGMILQYAAEKTTEF